MSSRVSVLIADDHPIFRQGLKQVIDSAPDLCVVAEAGNGNEALRCATLHRPQVALLDVDMPEMDGFETVRAIREAGLPVKLALLTLYRDEMHFNEALDLGIDGYIVKDSASADVVHCIHALLHGQNYVSPTLSTFLLNNRQSRSVSQQQIPALATLTATERRILFHLADYKTSREIASSICVSVRTVEKHRANICDKLNLHGSHALVKFAIQHKSKLA